MPSVPKRGSTAKTVNSASMPMATGCAKLTTIPDKAIERQVDAMGNTERFQSHTRSVDDHSTESVGGVKKIKALGGLKLLSGGSARLAAVDDLHQATGQDLPPPNNTAEFANNSVVAEALSVKLKTITSNS